MEVLDPQVYIATYLSTDVYESTINNTPIMRRCKDNWVNATQILKCCNFPKAKRTKILEKGVQQGMHEKIQGGYGRFQGTWVPLADAQRLATSYGVTPQLAPVLYLDLSDPNLVIPKKVKQVNKDGTPVKRKYVKKAKKPEETPTKKPKFDENEIFGGNSQDAFRQPQQLISQTQQQLQFQLQQQQLQQLPPNFAQHEFMAPTNQIPTFGTHNANGIPPEFQNYQAQFQRFQQEQQKQQHQHQQQQQQQMQLQHQIPQIPLPIQQQQTQLQQQKFFNGNNNANGNIAFGTFPPPPAQLIGQFPHGNLALSQSTNDTNWSQDDHKESDTSLSSSNEDVNKQHNNNNNNSGNNINNGSNSNNNNHKNGHSHDRTSMLDTSILTTTDTSIHSPKIMGNIQLQQIQSQQSNVLDDDENSYSAQLLRFFSEDNAEIPYFIHNPPFDFNINEAIDDEGHTPLHWSASIGNYSMIHILISKGANPLVVNNFGLNPLSKLILFNNCFELKNFPKVLDDLELCLINTDINGRTPIHYLCQFSKVGSKYESLRYYLDIILGKLTSLSNREGNKQANLLRNVLDHQDVNGDTCLHLAAKSASSKLVELLLSYGSRDDLINVNNETAKFIISNLNLQNRQQQQQLVVSGVLATPMQAYGVKIETPDTQKTTVQDEDDDEGMEIRNGIVGNSEGGDFVSKEHLQQLNISDDNKENIFKEESSNISNENIKTPMRKPHYNQNPSSVYLSLHQLAAILERTAESSPLRLSDVARNNQVTLNYNGNDASKNGSIQKNVNVIISYEPNPPELDENGQIVESNFENGHDDETNQTNIDGDLDLKLDINMEEEGNNDLLDQSPISSFSNQKLPMTDLSSMIHGMLNSLSTTYTEEAKQLDVQIQNSKKSLLQKKENLVFSTNAMNSILTKNGFREVSNLQDGKDLVTEEISKQDVILKQKEQSLLNTLEKNQAYQLASIVQQNEEFIEDDTSNEINENSNGEGINNGHDINQREETEEIDTSLQKKWETALELSKLQLKRTKLLGDVTNRIKYYGIDSKMYKYRKLISLSCGLKMEDIDGLIDGIEDSLMQSA